MYKTSHNLILGFHGCDEKVRDKVLMGKEHLKPSTNDYDWLGHGIYFWENNPDRALEYAKLIHKHPERCKTKIDKPSVIGAVINLGYCLDLLESDSIKIVQESYEVLKTAHKQANIPLPENKPIGKEKDLLIRKLDCAVIQMAHTIQDEKEQRIFDSARGMFPEGNTIYDNSGFLAKSHIQICITNPNCIKGYFLPLKENSKFIIP